MSTYNFQRVDLNDLDQNEFNNFADKSVFTTIDWIRFIAEDSQVEPYILRITDLEDEYVGYFSGFLTKKFGVKILGSPFTGWSTCYMSFDLARNDDRYELAKQVVNFAFTNDKVIYAEITDKKMTVDEAKSHGIEAHPVGTLQLPIDKDDAGLFKQMKTDCRNFIRQFERRGAQLEVAEMNDEFAQDYYDQLIDVFSKQGLVPTYRVDKVKCLVRNMKDSGNALCLRVRDPDGRPIATSLFFGYKKEFYFWGGASYREDQHYRPNEYMIWTAIKYFRDRGCTDFDMVGIRSYKKKFGSDELYYARLVFSKYRILEYARDTAKWLYYKLGKVKGFLKGRK